MAQRYGCHRLKSSSLRCNTDGGSEASFFSDHAKLSVRLLFSAYLVTYCRSCMLMNTCLVCNQVLHFCYGGSYLRRSLDSAHKPQLVKAEADVALADVLEVEPVQHLLLQRALALER